LLQPIIVRSLPSLLKELLTGPLLIR